MSSAEPQKVAIVRCRDYDPSRVQDSVSRAVELLGGVDLFSTEGETILVKPNLLSARPPEAGVTTHPSVIEAVVSLWIKAGSTVLLGDSPPLAGEKESSYRRLLEITGMTGVAERTSSQVVRFEESSVSVERSEGRYYKSYEIAGVVSESDAWINVPKLKTHGLTFLSCAVKNVFGCVPGRRKALFHAQAGEDREVFSQMLVDLFAAIPPRLTIVDAVTAMDGDGPVGGRLRDLGLIIAGTDPVAVDAVACSIQGIDPMTVATTRLAAEQGLGIADTNRIQVVGLSLEEATCGGFLEPRSKDFWTRLPRPVRNMLKNQLIPFPHITPDCRSCGACVEACPVKTINTGKVRPEIELSGCIRCYCCREVCEYGAIELRLGRLSRAIHLVRDARRAVLNRREKS